MGCLALGRGIGRPQNRRLVLAAKSSDLPAGDWIRASSELRCAVARRPFAMPKGKKKRKEEKGSKKKRRRKGVTTDFCSSRFLCVVFPGAGGSAGPGKEVGKCGTALEQW